MKSLNSPAFDATMRNRLLPIDDAAALIRAGAALAVAGRPAALAALPPGNWIGGSTPYFMTETGGVIVGDDQVFVSDFSAFPAATVACFDAESLERISGDAPDHGFVVAILPADSACHARFALEAGDYPQAFLKPTVGWIAGFDLNDPEGHAVVVDGRTGESHRDRAVALHVTLPEAAMLGIEIVNLFAPEGGDVLRFDAISSHPQACTVNGVPADFADYLRTHALDHGRLPLVGDFAGAHCNVSIRTVDAGGVTLYAPVFPGVDYHVARPVADYAESFRAALAARPAADTIWSCNCILNFLFGELEGKAIGGVGGPITFGEIAYQLLNQTLVRVRVS